MSLARYDFPMPLGLDGSAAAVRHIFIFTTYLATSNISHFERHISDRATYLGSSDISCAERHISLRATYLRERRHMMKFDICRSERHKSRATYVDVLRHMSLVRDRRRSLLGHHDRYTKHDTTREPRRHTPYAYHNPRGREGPSYRIMLAHRVY